MLESAHSKRKITHHCTESYLKQIKLLKKSSIEQALDKLYKMNRILASSHISGRQDTADKLKKYKTWFKVVCEELGESTTKDLDELRSYVKTIKDENDQYLDMLVATSKQLEHVIQSYNVNICEVHKCFTESNDMIATNKLQMSLLETDIDELRKENTSLRKEMITQREEFNNRLKVLEVKFEFLVSHSI